jgi:magnesium chelatase family protein
MAIARSQKKISGPLLDRIDFHVEVPRVDYEKLADKRNVEDSKTIRARVQAARERQLEGFKDTKMTCNAEMGPTEVRKFCQTDASGEKLLKLARTIADLAGSEMIAANHVYSFMIPSRCWLSVNDPKALAKLVELVQKKEMSEAVQ